MATSTLPMSSYNTLLMYKATEGGSYEKLVDIKSCPALGGSPELLETTTLSDAIQTFTLGIEQLDSFEFTANYVKGDFAKLKGLEGKEFEFAVYFGADGEDGIFSWKGKLSAHPNDFGVNEVKEMTITVSPSTPIEFE